MSLEMGFRVVLTLICALVVSGCAGNRYPTFDGLALNDTGEAVPIWVEVEFLPAGGQSFIWTRNLTMDAFGREFLEVGANQEGTYEVQARRESEPTQNLTIGFSHTAGPAGFVVHQTPAGLILNQIQRIDRNTWTDR